MKQIRKELSDGWQWFRRLPLLVQGVLWAAIGIGGALIALSLDEEPVDAGPTATIVEPGPEIRPDSRPNRDPEPNPAQKDPQRPPGSPPPGVDVVEVPENFRATTASVRRLFNDTFGGRGRTGQNRNILVSAKCERGNCKITYVPDGPGAGRHVEAQTVIWRALLKDESWRRGTIAVLPGGPDLLTPDGKRKPDAPPESAGTPILTVTCTREALESLGALGTQSAPSVSDACDVSSQERPGR